MHWTEQNHGACGSSRRWAYHLFIYLINLTSLRLRIACSFLALLLCLFDNSRTNPAVAWGIRDAERGFWGGKEGERRVCTALPEPYFFLPSKNRAVFHPLPPPQLVLGRAAEFSSLFLEVTETPSIEKPALSVAGSAWMEQMSWSSSLLFASLD